MRVQVASPNLLIPYMLCGQPLEAYVLSLIAAMNSSINARTLSSLDASANRRRSASLRMIRCLPAWLHTLMMRPLFRFKLGSKALVTRIVPTTFVPIVMVASSAPHVEPLKA